MESTQPDAFHQEHLNPEVSHSNGSNEISPLRKRERRRVSSQQDEFVRLAQKRRDRWSNRRETVERRVLALAGIVFLVLFIHVGVHLIIDQHLPLLNEVLFGIAALALAVWGGFRVVEWMVNKKYKHLTKQKRTDRVAKARDLQRSIQPNSRKSAD